MHHFRNPESGIWNLESGIRNPESGQSIFIGGPTGLILSLYPVPGVYYNKNDSRLSGIPPLASAGMPPPVLL